jgi:hypothetical protein
MSRIKSTKDALEQVIKLGVSAGIIVLKDGTSAYAAEKILKNAVDFGLQQIPENPIIQVDGRALEIPLDVLVSIVTPWIEAGIGAAVSALSHSMVNVEVKDGVTVSWEVK